MLGALIISRVRVKILKLFLLNPLNIFHVREIVRQTSEEINAVRRELAHMEKHGMVSKEPRGNRLYYSFRKDYPLYYDLLSLVTKTSGLGADILKNKSKLGKIKFVMLSGRFVRGKSSGSDEIDLLIVGQQVVIPELSQIIRTEEGRRGRELNYTVMTEEELKFRKKRRDPFIQNILGGCRLMIIGDEEELVN